MSDPAPYWINVDYPWNRCTLHRRGCRYEQAKRETPYKGIEHLKRDGGWLSFSSTRDADDYFHRLMQRKPRLTMIECADCSL